MCYDKIPQRRSCGEAFGSSRPAAAFMGRGAGAEKELIIDEMGMNP